MHGLERREALGRRPPRGEVDHVERLLELAELPARPAPHLVRLPRVRVQLQRRRAVRLRPLSCLVSIFSVVAAVSALAALGKLPRLKQLTLSFSACSQLPDLSFGRSSRTSIARWTNAQLGAVISRRFKRLLAWFKSCLA